MKNRQVALGVTGCALLLPVLMLWWAATPAEAQPEQRAEGEQAISEGLGGVHDLGILEFQWADGRLRLPMPHSGTSPADKTACWLSGMTTEGPGIISPYTGGAAGDAAQQGAYGVSYGNDGSARDVVWIPGSIAEIKVCTGDNTADGAIYDSGYMVAGGSFAQGAALVVNFEGAAAALNPNPPITGIGGIAHCIGYAMQSSSDVTTAYPDPPRYVRVFVQPFSVHYGADY